MLRVENQTNAHAQAQHWPNDYNIIKHPQMLRENLTIFKFEPTTPNMSQHVATRWPNARTRNMLHPILKTRALPFIINTTIFNYSQKRRIVKSEFITLSRKLGICINSENEDNHVRYTQKNRKFFSGNFRSI